MYLKGGTDLATSPDNQSAFIPTSAQWRTDSLDLSAFLGQTNLQVAFRNIGDWGNNLYLDNINLGSMANVQESIENPFSMYPNPVQSGACLTIQGEGIQKIKLISPEGKSIKADRFFTGDLFEIPENISTGTYILQIETKNKLVNKPLIIIH